MSLAATLTASRVMLGMILSSNCHPEDRHPPGGRRQTESVRIASLPFGATLCVIPGRGWRGSQAPFDPRLGGKGATWARGAQCG